MRDIARLVVAARGSQVQLRLEVHAQDDVALPLPGDGSGWRPLRATSPDSPPRRDAAGALWIAVPRGVDQVTLDGDVGDASSIEIALPLPVRAVQAQLEGWSLGGLDARGLAAGALSLTRAAPATRAPPPRSAPLPTRCRPSCASSAR